MPMRSTVILAVLLSCTSLISSASSQHLDDLAVENDLDRLMAANDTAALLTPAEQARLLALRGRAGAREAIQRVLTSKAVLEVTINPEARVSVHRTPTPLPSPTCGKPFPLLIRIVNQAGATSDLRVRASHPSTAALVEIQPPEPRLAGASVEYRALRLSLLHGGTTDITLVFDAGPGTEDLGNRATVSLLLRCLNADGP